MSRIAYVNGQYVPHADAAVHVEDRGYQFADGVYEVIAVQNGRLIDEAPHLVRLARSLGELRIAAPMTDTALVLVMREVIRRNRIRDGIVYLQINRGVAPRDHAFPKDTAPSIVMTARRAKPPSAAALENGVGIITIPDIRWARCDIKSVSLLPNILGKQQAKEAGAYEAWQVDGEGMVTEGTSTNAWIVSAEGELVTHPTGNEILNGVTRLAILDLARRNGLPFVERRFSVDEARRAREAFLTSTTSFVLPITEIDGQTVANGKPGSLARQLRELYTAYAGEQATPARTASEAPITTQITTM